jgi:hypothetical protein
MTSKLLLVVSFVLTLATSAQAETRCKAFAGSGDAYGIVAVAGNYNAALSACEEMNYSNCKVSCGVVSQRRCKGWAFGGRGMDLIAVANSEAGVAAACEAQGKRCQISCGTTSSTSQGRDWGRQGR